jgi:acetyl-CoA carboxylase biotin carboxyl carrier protein
VSETKAQRKDRRLDLGEIRKLAELMEAKDLVEVEIEEEGKRVHIVRGAARAAAPAPAYYAAPPVAPPPAHPGYHAPAPSPAQHAPAAAASAAPQARSGVEIPSPMVGTFYRSPGPDAPPFVDVGDRISKNTVVCIVEAMKVMNEIKAEVDGEILEVLVQNGEPVEFGQPLFLIKPPGGGAGAGAGGAA